MVGFFRKASSTSDVRPPPPPGLMQGALGPCTRCGSPVRIGQALDGGSTLAHFVCDEDIRAGVEKKVEAMRSLHRAIAALSNLPEIQQALAGEVARLPEAIEVGHAIEALERTRTLVECTAMHRPEQRRLALSYLDAMLRKLAPT